MEPTPDRILANLADVRDRIGAAATRSGRPADAVTLVAVTKAASEDAVGVLVAAGQTDLGENRAQQLAHRAELLRAEVVRWHMIGHLQRNKVKYILPHAMLIHSLDSVRLAQSLSDRAARDGAPERVRCLLEVNVAGEDAKHGVAPGEAARVASEAAALPGIELAGLMTMAPLVAEAEAARPVFAGLRELRDRLNREADLPAPLEALSMGMTQDFEVAVEEGATLVRVGSALFA